MPNLALRHLIEGVGWCYAFGVPHPSPWQAPPLLHDIGADLYLSQVCCRPKRGV